jgi:hypothetical protein
VVLKAGIPWSKRTRLNPSKETCRLSFHLEFCLNYERFLACSKGTGLKWIFSKERLFCNKIKDQLCALAVLLCFSVWLLEKFCLDNNFFTNFFLFRNPLRSFLGGNGTGSRDFKTRDKHLKVPKREIFDRSDFPDFYIIKSLCVGDFGDKIENSFKNN